MLMMIPFIINSLLNFVVSLLVAKFLGPAEYGRFVLAVSAGIVLQTLLLDWLRLAATRFYSERDRVAHPEIRSTLDAAFALLASLAVAAALALYALRIDLALTHDLVALAIGVGVTNALFDTATALVRARFHDRAYSALVIAKNLLAFALTLGGAFLFRSANVALLGMMVSVIGALVTARGELLDEKAHFSLAQHALAFRFLAYGKPIVLANFLYQSVPLIDRTVASQTIGFAEVGQISLAFEIGIRIVAAVGSALDVLLFQLAVRAEKDEGPAAARAQVTFNMGLVFAMVLPSIVGVWLVLPSFEALFVPDNYRGHFAHYFALMTPALFAFAIINFGLNPAFQITHKLAPLVISALIAVVANLLALGVLPPGADATRFAIAQSISSCAGLVALALMLFLLPPMWKPMWPRLRDMTGVLLAAAAMLALGLPLRALTPGILTMALQIVVGVAAYGAVAHALDIAGLRSRFAPTILKRLRRA